MSMFILSFIGAMPIGNFLAGIGAQHLRLGHWIGAQVTLAIGGIIIAVIVTIIIVRSPRMRALN